MSNPTGALNVVARNVTRAVINARAADRDRVLSSYLLRYRTRFLRRSVRSNRLSTHDRIGLILLRGVQVDDCPLTRAMRRANLRTERTVIRSESV